MFEVVLNMFRNQGRRDHMMKLRIFCLLILFPFDSFAQQSILKVQAEVPLQFGIGY